ncbi:MAG: transposase [Leptolyngbyaceae cyanobacterium]
MPRREMAFIPGQFYHLYNRGVNRDRIFFERENYLHFLRQWRRYLVPHTLDVLAYCLMPNHYHFLVQVRDEGLSEKMGFLSLAYTKAINKRHNRCGPLFQGRFQSIHVNEACYLLNLSRYIHLNPVKAQLVDTPQEWEFSSYQDYVELRRGSLPQFRMVRNGMGDAATYRSFVEVEDIRYLPPRRFMFDE